MNKKIIIIIIAVVLVIFVVSRSKAASNNTDGEGNASGSGNGVSNSGGGASGSVAKTTKVDVSKDDYWASGNGKGKEDHDAGKTLDQSKPTLSDSQREELAKKWHGLFDWTFSDDEFNELIRDCKQKIFTRADIFAVLNEDAYVYARVLAWIVNDPNRSRLERFNQVLASNGVEYQFERGMK